VIAGVLALLLAAGAAQAPAAPPAPAPFPQAAFDHLFEGKRAEALADIAGHVAKLRANGGLPKTPGWNFIAHLQLEAGDPTAALASYQEGYDWLKSDDCDWSEADKQVWIGRYHHGRGRCLARLGKHEEAWAEVQIVKKMIEAGGEAGTQYLPAWHYLAGYAKLEAGDAAAALEHLEAAGGQHDPHRTLLLGRACEKLGDLASARKHYEKVVSSRQPTLESAISYAEAKERLAGLAEVGRLGLTTKSAEARANVVDALRVLERFAPFPSNQDAARARELAQKAVEADPDFAFAHYVLGLGYVQGRAERDAMARAEKLAPQASDGECRFIAAALLKRVRKNADAVAAFEALRREYPREPLVAISLGQLYLDIEQPARAREVMETAVRLDPESARAQATLAHVRLWTGDYAGAREALDAARACLSGADPRGHLAYATALTYLYEGKAEAAIGPLQDDLERRTDPGGMPPVAEWNRIARIELELGDPALALTLYDKAYDTVAASALPDEQRKVWLAPRFEGRARCLARLGRHDEARTEADAFKKTIDDGAESSGAALAAYHVLLADLALERGDAPAAVEELSHAPADDPLVKLLLARAYERAGEREKARQTYQAVVDWKQDSVPRTLLSLERALAYPAAKKKLS
jgi:tetratricopeptide (TPR) repeat protein